MNNRTLDSSRTRHESGRFVSADRPDVLAKVVRGQSDLALWRRPPPAFHSWLQGLPATDLPRTHMSVPLNAVSYLAASACREAGHDCDGPAGILIRDIVELASCFCRLTGLEEIDLRLAAISNDACRRFHRDRMPFRLIVTYRGPGTLLVPPECASEALSLQGRYDGPLQAVECGTVALFRGSPAGNAGVVHRSPQIAGSGLTRLMLCLSTPF